MKLKLPERPALIDFDLEVWRDFTEWILGERVFRYTVPDAHRVYSPSWELLLSFEFEARKHITWILNNKAATSLKDAVILVTGDKNDPMAMGDQGLYQKHFLTPFSMRANIEAASKNASGGLPPQSDRHNLQEDPKGGGKKGGKKRKQPTNANTGAGKGGAPWKKHVKVKVGGKILCNKFNRLRGCEDTSAAHLQLHPHQCSLCGETSHGLANCPNKHKYF